nr:uncharacterized protein LOC128702032 [Cherax quadricarinatus]
MSGLQMKAVLVLTVAAAAAAQYYSPYSRLGYGLGGYGAGPLGGGLVGGGYGGTGLIGGGGLGLGYAKVDLSVGESDYHFSWRHDGGKKYDWHTANYYCSSLGKGWQGVSIETPEEDKIISGNTPARHAEEGKEDFLAELNSFYNDGIRWHDVACYHPKAIICERRIYKHYG